MTEPEKFHNLDSIIPKWQREGIYLYNELQTQIISRLWEKVTAGCYVHESCLSRFKIEYNNKTIEIHNKFCNINHSILFSKWSDEIEIAPYRNVAQKTKKRNSDPTIRIIGNCSSI